MTVDVVSHLRSISGQQNKIRGLRQRLQILREATAKQDTAVSHLLFVRRVPAVYRQCLAECMRRQVHRMPEPHMVLTLSRRAKADTREGGAKMQDSADSAALAMAVALTL